MIPARQCFPECPAADVRSSTAAALEPLLEGVRPGDRIAVAVGSRGISNLSIIVRCVVEGLRRTGAQPFLIPAMGSHGGGTAEGQVALLADYGVSSEALGAPLEPDLDVEELGCTAEGLEAVCSRVALAADGVLLVNRVKPHTDFHGPLGSGLLKMLVVGLGKREGARRFHAAASRLGYEPALRSLAACIQPRLRLLGGLAILEDQRHETVRIEGVWAGELEAREVELCEAARQLMPRLPFDDVDLLIVDRMGKNISGTGMDPAIIGRMIHGYSTLIDPAQPPPRVRRLLVRDLTPESRGNAVGIGLADFTTDRLVAAMDPRITRLNALTALSLQGAKIPLSFETDRAALGAALESLALSDPAGARVVHIRDTLSVHSFAHSLSLRGNARADCPIEETGEPREMTFDAAGNLAPCPAG